MSAPVDANRDYHVQLALLAQQTKKCHGTGPKPAPETNTLDGRVGNLFLDGSVLSEASLQTLYQRDPSLLGEFSNSVHVRLPTEYRTGPDLQQCFCGYFCFNPATLEAHLAENPKNEEVVAGLVERLERAVMDAASLQKFLGLVRGERDAEA